MPTYKYNGIDLITDRGENILKCSLLIFSKEELIEDCIITSTKTKRGGLDSVRVLLLKGNSNKYFFIIL